MARELFVYWKVAPADADAAFSAAAELLQTLRVAHPGLQARLLRRAHETGETGKAGETVRTDKQATFMETYSAAPADVTPALQAAIEAHARLCFGPLGHPARHVEVFDSLGS